MASAACDNPSLHRGAFTRGPQKKLIAAARDWAGGAGGNDAQESAAAFGLALQHTPDETEVWPECAESVELFLSLATQWRIEPMSGSVLGLDYAAARAAMDMLGVDDKRQAFQDLRIMEAEVIRLVQERNHGR
jgi:hypothetical protein